MVQQLDQNIPPAPPLWDRDQNPFKRVQRWRTRALKAEPGHSGPTEKLLELKFSTCQSRSAQSRFCRPIWANKSNPQLMGRSQNHSRPSEVRKKTKDLIIFCFISVFCILFLRIFRNIKRFDVELHVFLTNK